MCRGAFKELAILAYQDSMTGIMPKRLSKGNKVLKGFHETNSFFLCLTPTDPTTMLCVHAMTTSPDPDTRHSAAQVLKTFLQMNVGNKVAKPVTFHERVMEYDTDTPDKPNHLPNREVGQITRDICAYACAKYHVKSTRTIGTLNPNLTATQLVMVSTANACVVSSCLQWGRGG